MKMMMLVTVGALALSGCFSGPSGKDYTESYTTACTILTGNDRFPKSAVLQYCGCAAEIATQHRGGHISVEETKREIVYCAREVLSVDLSNAAFVRRAVALAGFTDPANAGVTYDM